MMKLWTIQGLEFDITRGRIDHSKSRSYTNANGETANVKDAYHKLWETLQEPDGQIIWCCSCDCLLPRTGTPKSLWSLRVPDDEIICRIDDYAWNKIIGKACDMPPRCRSRSRSESLINSCNAVLRARRTQLEPKGLTWWDELIARDQASGYFRSVLIRHPAPNAWVEERQNW